jgi:hypothetical protein
MEFKYLRKLLKKLAESPKTHHDIRLPELERDERSAMIEAVRAARSEQWIGGPSPDYSSDVIKQQKITPSGLNALRSHIEGSVEE